MRRPNLRGRRKQRPYNSTLEGSAPSVAQPMAGRPAEPRPSGSWALDVFHQAPAPRHARGGDRAQVPALPRGLPGRGRRGRGTVRRNGAGVSRRSNPGGDSRVRVRRCSLLAENFHTPPRRVPFQVGTRQLNAPFRVKRSLTKCCVGPALVAGPLSTRVSARRPAAALHSDCICPRRRLPFVDSARPC